MQANINLSESDSPATDLRDVAGYIPLPHRCMQDCGPACRLFGAIFDLKNGRNRSLFHAVQKIADAAGISRRAAFRHLDKLVGKGWIERYARPRNRRTCEVRVTPRGWQNREPFGVLPKWFPPSSPWSAAAIYSILLARGCCLETVLAEVDQTPEEMGEPIVYSFRNLARLTGLSLRSVQNGIAWLSEHQFISSDAFDDGSFFELLPIPQRLPERPGVANLALFQP